MGSISVSSPPSAFEAAPRLRIRPVFEWDGCLVYDPNRRRLTELNLAAWLVLELCDGRPSREIGKAFFTIVGSRVEGRQSEKHVRSALVQLIRAGLVKRCVAREGEREAEG
jgi:hypothetical protein